MNRSRMCYWWCLLLSSGLDDLTGGEDDNESNGCNDSPRRRDSPRVNGNCESFLQMAIFFFRPVILICPISDHSSFFCQFDFDTFNLKMCTLPINSVHGPISSGQWLRTMKLDYTETGEIILLLMIFWHNSLSIKVTSPLPLAWVKMRVAKVPAELIVVREAENVAHRTEVEGLEGMANQGREEEVWATMTSWAQAWRNQANSTTA